MTNVDIQLNKIIQSGVYYTTSSTDNKTRPYLVISKDQGYSMYILAFKITSKFKDKHYIVPIQISGRVSFIVCSETISLDVQDLLGAQFVGVLNPPLFNICTTMFTSRIMDIDTTSMNRDMCEYLDIMEDAKVPLYDDPDTLFTKDLIRDKVLYEDVSENSSDSIVKYDYRKEIKKPSFSGRF